MLLAKEAFFMQKIKILRLFKWGIKKYNYFHELK